MSQGCARLASLALPLSQIPSERRHSPASGSKNSPITSYPTGITKSLVDFKL
ncbi:hypothetical protein [Kamptonema formosum]|uniref:hypothetical protein n=1 Tax=Kamptonema formosum TaxID=331992 RepID=UPI00034B1C84|nr:hypothetical protein [Oscillatoria sp. PCC 10802]